LIEATIKTNQGQWARAVEICRQGLKGLQGRKIAVLGLSFKPDTDDIREAVSIPLIRALLKEGGTVRVYDPAAMNNARNVLGDSVEYASTSLACMDGADCCILVTEWGEFKKLRPNDFAGKLRRPLVIDGRRVYDASSFRRAGITFHAIGLGPEEGESEHRL